MNPATVAVIDARLDAVRCEHRVAIPLAIESGSRAWGFPSPDSDYDCRFIYVRRREDYLSLFPMRDVIETPLDKTFDVNGWDVTKALRLLLKGNAVVIEWLTSPIIYVADAAFRADFHALAARLADRRLVGRHYLHLGERQRRAYFADGTQIPLKKLFYALRPAAALRWLRCHPAEAVAPMHFQTLLRGCDAPAELLTLVEDLIARKAVTRELGSGELPALVAAFVDAELSAARDIFEAGPRPAAPEARAEAQAFFHDALAKFGG
ncbi:MAG: nucleotidyltransferase domain-containing protein [Alphaproteobacteria bacterium]|nr:nucleotidyltransferase domain-containing protein [Alphaproteobacteria bacterium]MBL6939020.1 nucleotidyltransferase domain-containing protein [Alphaproteobacteria bacterium]MBL7099612.1 nucleotidyltransferase domain-containing protein [Alphaproteobacteria bacterium]